MSRARSALAARTSVEKLKAAVCEAYGCSPYEEARFTEFYDVAQFCREHSEELGGEVGSDGWCFWQVGEWAVLSDLSQALVRNTDALAALSEALGTEVMAAAVDIGFQSAAFLRADEGEITRRLMLEDQLITDEGVPTEAEHGLHLEDFTEVEAEQLWRHYKLPTFEHDPLDDTFECVAVRFNG